MKKVIAIGGGEILNKETLTIDKEIIKLTNKKNPKLLFLPTASSDSEGYYKTVQNYFGKKLGCKTSVLYLIKDTITKEKLAKEILAADIIYVGGGNTLKMMKIWKKLGVDKLLKQAYDRGAVLSGLSAGAICWFKFGNSDSRKMLNPKAPLIKVQGLNFFPALFCPHYDSESYRKPELKEMMRKVSGIAIAVDNCCAIEIVDDKYRIISSKDSANAYKVFWSKGKYHQVLIQKQKQFMPWNNLFKK